MISIYITIMLLQISCLILPGPDFFVTISNSIKHGYKYGIITALGIGFGISLNTLFTYWFGSFLQYQEPLLFKGLILLGTFYLIYIAFSLFKNVFSKTKANPNAQTHIKNLNIADTTKTKVFFGGAFTNLANVKAVVFFSSMLSLVNELNTAMTMLTWISISISTSIWFCIVAIVFGNNILREKFLNNMKKIEFVSGSFISAFACVILIELFK